MNKAETMGGLVFVAIGVFMAVEAKPMPYMVEGVPGPGFLPWWIAIGLIAAGAVLTVKAVRGTLVQEEPTEWPDSRGWARVSLMFVALAISLLVLNPLGFLITTTLFMLVVLYGLGVRSWFTLTATALLAAIGLYVVFAVWLQVPLPKGVLEGIA
jgi:putative tricarboxylic transport membrane protein